MKVIFKYITLFTLFLTVFSCLDANKKDAQIIVISAEEMQAILTQDDVQLVDVRTATEYNTAHIANAQNIDFSSPTFDQDILKLNKTQPVILYCKSGGRSAKCAAKLQKAGFKKIYDLDGGMSKWLHSNKINVVTPN